MLLCLLEHPVHLLRAVIVVMHKHTGPHTTLGQGGFCLFYSVRPVLEILVLLMKDKRTVYLLISACSPDGNPWEAFWLGYAFLTDWSKIWKWLSTILLVSMVTLSYPGLGLWVDSSDTPPCVFICMCTLSQQLGSQEHVFKDIKIFYCMHHTAIA